jgi:hypothetical protein
MLVDRSDATGLSDSAAILDSWVQMKSHRWARTSLHRVVALPITVSIRGAITSLTTGQSFASFAGVRWKKYFLTQACAIPVEPVLSRNRINDVQAAER